jgi:trehalose 6-phosphate phosphatase
VDGSVVSEEVAAGAVAVQAALAELNTRTDELPQGVLIEDKAFTASVHYRLAADPDAAAATLKGILSGIASRAGIVITEGRLVYELRPRIHINKGVFVSNDVHLHKIGTAAFLGDDLTDLDGFRAIHALLESGELSAGYTVGVRAAESPPEVIAESDLLVEGVVGMVAELAALSASLAGVHQE